MQNLGQIYGKTALMVDGDYLENRYRTKPSTFNSTGEASLLKTLGIPKSFYKKQDDDLRSRILAAQKVETTAKSQFFYVLQDEEGDESPIDYVSPSTKIEFSEVKELEEFFQTPGWTRRSSDYRKGVSTIISKPANIPTNKYFPSTFLTVPLFWSGPMVLTQGIYKLICTNGARTSAFTGHVKLNLNDFSVSVMASVLDAMAEKQSASGSIWNRVTEQLENATLSVPQAKDYLQELLSEERVSKTLLIAVGKSLERYETGEAQEELLPKTLNSKMDLFDVFTYFSHHMPSEGSITTAEIQTFSTFMDWLGATQDVKDLAKTLRYKKPREMQSQRQITAGEAEVGVFLGIS